MKTLLLFALLIAGSAHAQTDHAVVTLANGSGAQLNLSKSVTRPLYRTETYQSVCQTTQSHFEPCHMFNPYSVMLPAGSVLQGYSCNCNSYSNMGNGRYQCFSYMTYLTYSCQQQRTVEYGSELLFTNGVAAQVNVVGNPPIDVAVDAVITDQNELKLSCSNDQTIVMETRNLNTAGMDANKLILTTGSITFTTKPVKDFFGNFDGNLSSARLNDSVLTVRVKSNRISETPSIQNLKLSYDGIFGRNVIAFNGTILPNAYTVVSEGDSLVYSIDLDGLDLKLKKIIKKDSRVSVRFSGNQMLPANMINSPETMNSVLNRNSNTLKIQKD